MTTGFNLELKNKKKSGPKPNKIIRKYLKSTTGESLSYIDIN